MHYKPFPHMVYQLHFDAQLHYFVHIRVRYGRHCAFPVPQIPDVVHEKAQCTTLNQELSHGIRLNAGL